MDIIYKNYRLEPELGRFNLYATKPYDVKKEGVKTGEVREKEFLLGYGKTFESAVRRIADDILADREGLISIAGYLNEYRKITQDILETREEATTSQEA